MISYKKYFYIMHFSPDIYRTQFGDVIVKSPMRFIQI